MIYESSYWKEPLLEGASLIRDYMEREELSDEQGARLEREIFIGFYAIRKLLEAVAKVGNATRQLQLSLQWYPKRPEAPIVDWYNRMEFWELYDMDDARSESKDMLYVAHRMVHSFEFIISGNDDGHGVFFTSDRDKEVRLNFIPTSEIVRAFETVGSDYPAGMRYKRDPLTGERKWEVVD